VPLRSSMQARLPSNLLQRASLLNDEYGWALADIPAVIEAARDGELLNVGGTLQFRIPQKFGGHNCDCYWVSVNTYESVPEDRRWGERVVKAAQTALADFLHLRIKYDFIKEGMVEYAAELKAAEAQGAKLEDLMYFAWHALDANEEAALRKKKALF
jgi:hypothetical protein